MTRGGGAGGGALRWTLCALAVAGVVISAYLTYSHLSGTAPVCVGGSGGCETVQTSRYSEVLGVPVALIGVLGYVAMLLAALMRAERAVILGVFAALTGTLYTAYLTYLELFVIRAICQWCVASAIVVTLYLLLSVLRLRRFDVASDTVGEG